MAKRSSTGRMIVLEETPDSFLTESNGIQIPVSKKSISPKLQEDYRSRLEVPIIPEMEESIAIPPQPPMTPQSAQQRAPMNMPQQGLNNQAKAIENIGEIEGRKEQVISDLKQDFADKHLRVSPQDELRMEEKFAPIFNRMAALPQEYEQTMQKLSESEIDPDRLWNNASTAQKAAGFLGLILSGIGSGLTGQRNGALDVITRAIENDIDAQKENRKNLQNKASGIMNAYNFYKEQLGDETAARNASVDFGLQKLQNQLEVTASKYNSPIVQERAALEIGKIQEKRDLYKQEALDTANSLQLKQAEQIYKQQQDLLKNLKDERGYQFEREKFEREQGLKEKNAESKPGEKVNAAQSTAAGLALRAKQALGDLENLKQNDYNREDLLSGIGSKLPNVFRGSNGVSQDQAELNFVTAVLRSESGAAITEAEYQRDRAKYFPRVGDSEKTIEQKRQAREAAVAGLEAKAGKQALSEIGQGFNAISHGIGEIKEIINPKTGLKEKRQKTAKGWERIK